MGFEIMRIQPEIDGASIILIGNFNPTIFTPDWFLKYNLLSKEDYEQTKTKVIHSEIADFQNQWLKVQVLGNRFLAETQEKPFIRIHDFVLKTFKQYLFHTPLQQLGINRTIHFNAGSEANRDNIGCALAPREPWGKWGKKINSGKALKHGGMRNLIMEIRDLDDRSEGVIKVIVQPSPDVDYGVRVDINDHFELPESDDVVGDADLIMQMLEENFEASHARSEEIIDQIMGLAE